MSFIEIIKRVEGYTDGPRGIHSPIVTRQRHAAGDMRQRRRRLAHSARNFGSGQADSQGHRRRLNRNYSDARRRNEAELAREGPSGGRTWIRGYYRDLPRGQRIWVRGHWSQ